MTDHSTHRVRFGIVGTGNICHKLADALSQTDCAVPYAVCSRSSDTARAFAEQWGMTGEYTDYDSFLSDPNIDAVYIATPNKFHFEYAQKSLKMGKPTLCEKPMTTSEADTAALFDLSDRMGVQLYEAMRPAHDPAYRAVKEAIEHIGKLRYARLEFCQYSSRYDAFLRGEIQRAFDPSYGNSALLDIGVYPIYMATVLFGYPHSINAGNVFLSNGFDGMGTVSLGYGDSMVDIVYSKVSQSVCPSVIMGELGSVTIDKVSMPARVELLLRGSKPQILYDTPIQNSMIFEISDFCAALHAPTPHPTRDHSIMTARIMDEVNRQIGVSF